jgi:hypothetical protein
MVESQIFLGIKELPPLQEMLRKNPPQLLALFIQDQSEANIYLQRAGYHQHSYLGKFLGSHADLSCLDLIQANITSLLRRLAPEYPFQDVDLELFPIIILETTVQDDKVMQSFELESLLMGGDHSQKVKASPIRSDDGSKDCGNLSSSTAVSRIIQ